MLSQNISMKLLFCAADLNDTVVEACNQAHSCIPHYQQTDNIIDRQHAWEVEAASTVQVGEYPP